MSRIRIKDRHLLYASWIKPENIDLYAKDFKNKYRQFIKNFIMARGYNRHELFNGWFFNDDLFVRISCNRTYSKLYINFYDRDLVKNKKEKKRKYKRYLEIPDFYDEVILDIKFTKDPETNEEEYLRINESNWNTSKRLIPAKFLDRLLENKLNAPYVHRLIMACYLNIEGKNVHHLNHEKEDNNFWKLALVDGVKHGKYHIEYPRNKPLNNKKAIKDWWLKEIKERNEAYKKENKLKQRNFEHKTDADEVLFKICYYLNILKKPDGKRYTLGEIKFRAVGINKNGCYDEETISKIKKKFVCFTDFFNSLFDES